MSMRMATQSATLPSSSRVTCSRVLSLPTEPADWVRESEREYFFSSAGVEVLVGMLEREMGWGLRTG